MDEKIDTAISNLVAMVRANIKADEALKTLAPELYRNFSAPKHAK